MVTPSLLTTTVPMTPLCPTNLFRVSSTSVAIVVLLSHCTGVTLVSHWCSVNLLSVGSRNLSPSQVSDLRDWKLSG